MKTSQVFLGLRRILAPALFLSAFALGAQVSPYRVESRIFWETRVLRVDVRLDIRAVGIRLPAGRLEAERMIDRDFPGLAKNPVFALRVDSRRTVADTVEDGSLEVAELLAIADLAHRTEASFTKDMSSFSASYEIPIDAIGTMYLRHAIPSSFAPAPDWAPSRSFTGIVIYAKGEFPVHGENRMAVLAPCLFPRIFDDSMDLIFDRGVVDPLVLRSQGEAAYSGSYGSLALDRVGDDPLRIMATEVFGLLRTDLVIPDEDAKRILALPENQRLLREGKVLIVLDTPAADAAGASSR